MSAPRSFDPYPHVWRLPLLIWQGAFFVVPLLFMAAMSFWLVKNYRMEPAFVFDNWEKMLGRGAFWDAYWLTLLPPTLPLVILGLAMLAWLSQVGLSGTLTGIIIAHVVLATPFAMAICRLRLSQMDPALEAAAWNLGADQWRAMRHVILPFCAPAIVSALYLTAAVSFDEFVVAWFVSGLNRTVPVMILEILQGNVDPQINAIGTVVFLTSMSLVVAAQLLIFRRRRNG